VDEPDPLVGELQRQRRGRHLLIAAALVVLGTVAAALLLAF
jgi:hypothetical protein